MFLRILKGKEERRIDHCGATFTSSLCSLPPEIKLYKTHENVDLCTAEQQALERRRSIPGFCFDYLKTELLTWTNL